MFPIAGILGVAALALPLNAGQESPVGSDVPVSASRAQPHAVPAPAPAPPWGSTGHQMAARGAVAALPDEIPAFFREASEQLVYLNPEPDRWRVRESEEMDQAFAYDHYIDLENVPSGALDAPNRFEFLRMLYEAGVARPERDVGFLPFRIVELYQRLVTGWRQWRAEENPARREWIAQRIVNDAGILGHYVTDASQPHHTTIHFNGWARGIPNPERYTRDPRFHARFESAFVEAHVTYEDIARHLRPGPAPPMAGSVRDVVLGHILEAHALVEMLYRLDREVGFEPDEPAHEAAVEFAAARIASGANMLAVLWVSAWLESAAPTDGSG